MGLGKLAQLVGLWLVTVTVAVKEEGRVRGGGRVRGRDRVQGRVVEFGPRGGRSEG